MTLRDYASVLWARRWIVILPMLVAGAVAFSVTSLFTPVYQTSSEVLVEPRGQDGLFSEEILRLNDRAIDTEIQVIEGEVVRQRVQMNLELAEEPPRATASAVNNTDVIAISVRDENAANAATLADAYAVAYIEVRREQAVEQLLAASAEVQAAIDDLQSQIDVLPPEDLRRPGLLAQLANFQTTLDQLRVDAALRTGGAAVIKSAEVPSSPVEPTPVRTAALAVVVGFIIGVAAAFLMNYLDQKVRTPQEIENATKSPVLAVVPVDSPPDHRPIALSASSHEAAEAYRGLRTNLQFLGLDEPIRVIQLTSSLAEEGKTTTSANLAVVLAQAGHRVALVDADLRRPRVHSVFSVEQTPGFTDLLLGASSDQVVNHVDVGSGQKLSVYASGAAPSNPSEMLSGRRVRQLLNEMGGHYDFVVVDSAPVLPVSDSIALSGSVDGVLVVAQAGRITTDEIAETTERLRRVGAPLLGVVLNQAQRSGPAAYAYGGYGSYQHAEAVSQLPQATDRPDDEDALVPDH